MALFLVSIIFTKPIYNAALKIHTVNVVNIHCTVSVGIRKRKQVHYEVTGKVWLLQYT